MNEFYNLLSQSAIDFQNIVWPTVCRLPIIGGGELKPVEAVSSESFTEDLDLLAGIDAWQIIRQIPIVRGLESRVQWGTNYQTFSIRYSLPSGQPTEFEKRQQAIQNRERGDLFPHITVQAYLDRPGGALLSAAAIRTEALISAAGQLVSNDVVANSRYPDLYGLITNPTDGISFLYMSWKYLAHKGFLANEDVYPIVL
jgi:hypothetical protein